MAKIMTINGLGRRQRYLDGVEALQRARHETRSHMLAVHFHDSHLSTRRHCHKRNTKELVKTVI